ncbi:Hpt domain-containing protein [Nocardioides rubriscoriae]|uniref:Hpt domain-containing protein n=1 Tax=Nocardioides rubriscoriae TaxID=642762 RepID=UPI0011E01646|nr:Hpt domain-containing protein [Nocardioides rubriscoriae]
MSASDHAGLAPTAPIAGLDVGRLDTLRDLDPGDTTYIDRAIGNFQVNSEAAVVAIRESVAAGDTAAVVARAHKIAGSALNLGCLRAGEAARAVELAADTGSVEPVVALLDELTDAMTEGRALLLAYQATYAG